MYNITRIIIKPHGNGLNDTTTTLLLLIPHLLITAPLLKVLYKSFRISRLINWQCKRIETKSRLWWVVFVDDDGDDLVHCNKYT